MPPRAAVDEPVDLVRDGRRVVAGGLVAELEGRGRVEDDRMRRVPRVRPTRRGAVVEEHLLPGVAELPRDRARDLERARRIGVGAVQDPRARATPPRPRSARRCSRLRSCGRRPRPDGRGRPRGAGRARASRRPTRAAAREPGPWIFDGRSTVTGARCRAGPARPRPCSRRSPRGSCSRRSRGHRRLRLPERAVEARLRLRVRVVPVAVDVHRLARDHHGRLSLARERQQRAASSAVKQTQSTSRSAPAPKAAAS